MSNETQEFEKLRKLLKIKNYEQPPPGYFNNFSTKVTNRIEAEARRKQDKPHDAYWLQKFVNLLESNPLAAGLFGVCTCGLLIAGIAYSQYREPTDYAASGAAGLQTADSDGSTGDSSSFSKVMDGRLAMHTSTEPMMTMLDTNSQSASMQFDMGAPTVSPVLYNPAQ